jgi:hypothetical protein
MMVIAAFPLKTPVTLAADGNGGFEITGIFLQVLRVNLQYAVHWAWVSG